MSEAHLADFYDVTPADDGESLGIKFVRSDGREILVAIPLDELHKFVDEVSKGVELCVARAAAAKADPPTSTLQ